jgi:hypothetical protein
MARLSKKQMIYHLSTFLKNRGIDKDLIDLEALVDENLIYEENKQIVLKHLLEKDEKELKNYEDKALDDLKNHLFNEARKIHEDRDFEEMEKDEETKAKTVFDLNKAKSEEELYNKFITWMENINNLDKFDIEGVDYLGDDTMEEDKNELREHVGKFLNAKIELSNHLKKHKVNEKDLKEIWEEVLKLEGKNAKKSMKTDKKKKAKKRLKPTVKNIINWMINPAKCDLVGVDE